MLIFCLNFLFESFMKCKSSYFVNTFYQQFKQRKPFQNFSISNIQSEMEIWIFCLNYLSSLYHLSIVLKTCFPLSAIIAAVEWPSMIHWRILCKYAGGESFRSFYSALKCSCILQLLFIIFGVLKTSTNGYRCETWNKTRYIYLI